MNEIVKTGEAATEEDTIRVLSNTLYPGAKRESMSSGFELLQ